MSKQRKPTIKFFCSLGILRLGHYKTKIESNGTNICIILIDHKGQKYFGVNGVKTLNAIEREKLK